MLEGLAAEAAAASNANISTLRLKGLRLASAGSRSAQTFGKISKSSGIGARTLDVMVFVKAVPAMKNSLNVLDLRDLINETVIEWIEGHSWMFFNAIGKLLNLRQLILNEAVWKALTRGGMDAAAPLTNIEGLQVRLCVTSPELICTAARKSRLFSFALRHL